MPWFRVDDRLPFHTKTVTAGNCALGLWVRAGAWSAEQLTDGFISTEMVQLLGTTAQAKRLSTAGLWLPLDTGFQFHDWGDFQPTKAEVEQRRKAGAERLRAWRAAERGENVRLLNPVEGEPDDDS